MGRRPNPLVVEFFERGAKLEDKTNRYEHRCKKCGELFPKGRSDSLTSHLLRKCPNVTQQDREWVFDQIQQAPDKNKVKSNRPASKVSRSLEEEAVQSDIPFPNFQQQSALDTLAEVSRHHLDYSSQRPFSEIFQDQRVEPVSEQAFIAQLRESIDNSITNAGPENLYSYTENAEQPHSLGPEASTSTVTFASSPLVQTASAANQQLEQAQSVVLPQDNSIVDPQLGDMGAPLQKPDTRIDQEAQSMAWSTTNGNQPALGPVLMPSNSATPAFSVLQKSSKQKTRSHFNDTRRKEVQEIRKRGACIRCRMLKKPCSGETPCNTCRNVESARLWKGKCLRTRIADEFSLWSTNLFYARTKIQISAAVHELVPLNMPGRMEARLFAGSDFGISFAVKAYCKTASGVDPNLPNNNNCSTDIWLLDEGDSMADKLELYVNRIIDFLIRDEISYFIKATLSRALALVQAGENDQGARMADTSDQKSSRSCYSLQNQLLKNVIELWVCTRLLTSSDQYPLQLRYSSNQTPRHLPEEVNWATVGDHHTPVDSVRLPQTHQLNKSQLMASLESRCAKLSKSVMNELERRLLQRQQVSRFATFLSSVILLNAVELMTGFYRAFDNNHLSPQTSYGPGKENISTNPAHDKNPMVSAALDGISYRTTAQPYFWPLDTAPSSLWTQGPHFADLLTMLLRMRALPPKTCQSSEGTLVALQDYSLPVHVNGRPAREQIDEQTRSAAEWLDPLGLSVGELMQMRDGPLPGPEDGVDAWGMRFISRVLLPERIK